MSLPRRPVCAIAFVAFSALGALHVTSPAPSLRNVSGVLTAPGVAYVEGAATRRTTDDPTTRPSVATATLGARKVGATVARRAVAPTGVPAPVGALRMVRLSAGVPTVSAAAPAGPGSQTRGATATTSARLDDFAYKVSDPGATQLYLSDEPAGVPPVTPPPVPAAGTQFGMSVAPRPGESAAGAVTRLRQQFGGLPVVRVFSPGLLPTTWDGDATLAALGSDSSVVYSFKADMDAVASGAYDDRLRGFLASRPAGVKVWVALHHEPEDDIAGGAFTAEQFRTATAHLAPVIRQAGGIPTTILMQYTLSSTSGRDWHRYYSPAVDVLAWDGYNTAAAGRSPGYKSAEDYVRPVLAVAAETGKAFGWAELGSPCITGDSACQGRAAWLASLERSFSRVGAQFATYWNRPDFGGGFDYSLSDGPSVEAWKAGMRR